MTVRSSQVLVGSHCCGVFFSLPPGAVRALLFSLEDFQPLQLLHFSPLLLNDPPRMERKEMSRRILHFTLEIISLLSGEDYTLVKKTSGGTPIIHETPITDPPSLIHEQKILEITNKMIELLTGEVPIRCQDVAVYFSMEEWEYIEGQKDRYEDAMMEDPRPLTSPDSNSRRRNPPERCLRPLYSQDCPEEKPPENHQMRNQGEDLTDIKVEDEEERMMADPPCKSEVEEDIPVHFTTDCDSRRRNPTKRCPRRLYSQDCPEEKLAENHQDENLIDIKVEVIDDEEEETDLWGDQQYGLIERNPLARCPRPLYSQDCPEEKPPENHQMRNQGEDLTDIKVEDEEERMMGDPPCKSEVEEDIPVHVTTGNPSKKSEGNFMLSLDYKVEDEDVMQRSSGENLITCNVHPGLHTTDLPYNPPDHKEPSPDQSQIVTTSTGQKEGKRFHCGECGKYFTKSLGLMRHRRIHTGEKPYSCSVCGKCFTQKADVVKHERIHTGEKPYSCSECGKCFTQKSSLDQHKKSHTGEKPYSCSECGKCFKDKSNLAMHGRSHTREKPYSCSECGKHFKNKSYLVKHERIHTGVTPYSCSVCGKYFIGKSNLVVHERIHTGERPYSCSQCEKAFTNRSELVIHERIHTGEKPYSCSKCRKCFRGKSDLSRHERVHTGEKPYSCSECGRCFKNKPDLVRHERIHTGEKAY